MHRASEGWINANLVTFVPVTVLVIGGLVLAWGQYRLADLGLSSGWALRLAAFLAAGWLAVQLLGVISTMITGTPVASHPAWAEYGAGTLVGLFIAMVLGTAIFEDALF